MTRLHCVVRPLVVLTAVLAAPLASEQVQPLWQSTGGPSAATGLALTRTVDGDLLLGVHGGVMRRDVGDESWRPSGLEGRRVVSLLSTAGGRVLAGCGLSGGVWQSDDQGRTWAEMSEGLNGLARSAGGLLETTDQVVVAATQQGIYRRTPDEDSWRPTGFEDAAHHLVAGADPVQYCISQGDLLRSTDRGESWEQIEVLEGVAARTVAADEDARVLVGCEQPRSDSCGAWLSLNGGESFDCVDDGLGLDVPVAAAVLPNGDLITAGSSEHIGADSGGVWRSPDLGASWTMAGHNRADVFDLWYPGENELWMSTRANLYRADASDLVWERKMEGLNQASIRILTADVGGILAGGWDFGLHRLESGLSGWVDLGLEGQSLGCALRNQAGDLLACGDWELLRFDEGTGWEPTGLFGDSPNALVETPGGTLCGVFSSGVACAELDPGDHWCSVLFERGWPRAIAASGDGSVLVAIQGSSPSDANLLLRSTDGGCSWVETSATEEPVSALESDGGSRAMACSADGAVLLSEDSGATWEARGQLGGRVTALTWDDAGQVFAATHDTVWTSEDLGLTWRPFGRALGEFEPTALAVHGDALFAGSAMAGVFRVPLDGPPIRQPSFRTISSRDGD